MHVKDWRSLMSDLAVIYSSHNFNRSGARFQRLSADGSLAQEVWYQKHSKGRAEFTVNLEVWVIGVEFPDIPWVKLHERTVTPHWRIRLGEIISGFDTWWPLPSHQDDSAWLHLADEHRGHISNEIIPQFESLSGVQQVIELWRSGSCPGIWSSRRDELAAAAEALIK